MPRAYKSVPTVNEKSNILAPNNESTGPKKGPAGNTRMQASKERMARLNKAKSMNARSNDDASKMTLRSGKKRHISVLDTQKKDSYDSIETENNHAYDEHKGIEEAEKPKMGAYIRKNQDAFGVQAPEAKVIHPLLKGSSKSSLKRGIIYSEVLGKPRGLQS